MKLSTEAVMIEGSYFRVEDFPWEDVEKNGYLALKKGVAYRYVTSFTRALFPYRGVMDDKFSYNSSKVGIWFKRLSHTEYVKRIVYPRTMKEKEEYAYGREKDIIAAVLDNEYLPDQFADNDYAAADSGVTVFMPPVHTDDDSLNMIMKTAIRLKAVPFEPYGRRLQAMAVDNRPGTERSNAKNNAKRGILNNRALSMGKFAQYTDVWETVAAVILKDRKHSMHPMHIPEGKKMLVIYPNGIPFEINNEDLLDISDLVADAITDSGEVDYTDEEESEE